MYENTLDTMHYNARLMLGAWCVFELFNANPGPANQTPWILRGKKCLSLNI